MATSKKKPFNDKRKKPLRVMPYSMLVGQRQLKLALEISYIAPRIGGVLLSGQRGTGKSTVVRAFSHMVYGELPVTIPINATEDRVVGGWDLRELFKAKPVAQAGLIEEADGKLLYIDEVNLLDDHIVNIILDVTSTGILVIQREGRDAEKEVRFTLVGTMNPSEGGLRPQLLDRFGLMVDVITEPPDVRSKILQVVLDYDMALAMERAGQTGGLRKELEAKREQDKVRKAELDKAKANFPKVVLPPDVAEGCVRISSVIQAEGHRGDYVMAVAARANAALREVRKAEMSDLIEVAPLSLQHRRSGSLPSGGTLWSTEDDAMIHQLLNSPAQAAESVSLT
jgi:magnesium chelatase subunit I